MLDSQRHLEVKSLSPICPMATLAEAHEVFEAVGFLPVAGEVLHSLDMMNLKRLISRFAFPTRLASVFVSLQGQFSLFWPVRAIVRLITALVCGGKLGIGSDGFIPAFWRAEAKTGVLPFARANVLAPAMLTDAGVEFGWSGFGLRPAFTTIPTNTVGTPGCARCHIDRFATTLAGIFDTTSRWSRLDHLHLALDRAIESRTSRNVRGAAPKRLPANNALPYHTLALPFSPRLPFQSYAAAFVRTVERVAFGGRRGGAIEQVTTEDTRFLDTRPNSVHT